MNRPFHFRLPMSLHGENDRLQTLCLGLVDVTDTRRGFARSRSRARLAWGENEVADCDSPVLSFELVQQD
jgi:hypothetical protein